MRICSFPLDDAAIQTIHPKDVYLIKMADEQSMELFVMQEDLLTTYYTCHMSPYLWKRIKRAFSISKNTSNDLWEWKSSGRGDDWYWKRSIPTQYQKKLERLILLDQFWAKHWRLQPAFCPSVLRLLHKLARKKNPCAPFSKSIGHNNSFTPPQQNPRLEKNRKRTESEKRKMLPQIFALFIESR